MFCPKCATQNGEGAKFCRACDANISLVPQALTDQLPTASKNFDNLPPRIRRRFGHGPPSVQEGIRWIFTGVSFLIVAMGLLFGLAIAASQTHKTSTAPGVPLRLNQTEVGDTNDTSRLEGALTQLFEDRRRNRAFRPGTNDPVNLVYPWPEETLKLTEVAKVVNAIRRKANGQGYLYVAADEKPSGKLHADPLQLTLFMGNPKSAAPVIWQDSRGSLATDSGINLIFNLEMTIRPSDADESLAQTIEIPKDGEYLIGFKPVARSDLRSAMRAQMKGGRPFTFVFVGSDVNWRSLAEVGAAAYSSGIVQFTVGSLMP